MTRGGGWAAARAVLACLSLAVRTSAEAGGPAAGLTLDAAVAEALARAPEVRAAAAEVERLSAGVGVARSGLLPRLDAAGDLRRSETWRSTSLLGLDEATAGVSLTARQALLTFGRLPRLVEAATEEEAAAIADLAAARASVRLAVETAFYDALLGAERVATAREALAHAEALLGRARAREAAGDGTRFDVVRAEAEFATAAARLSDAEALEATARGRLAAALGRPASAPVEPLGSFDETAPPPVPLEAAERLAEAERPDLAVLERRLRAARALVDYERAQGRPSVDLVGSASYTRHDYISRSNFFSGRDASSGYVGVGVTLPLFDGGRVRETTRAQEAIVRAQEARFERARLDALREVREAHRDEAAARVAEEARAASVRAARESLRLAEVSFDAGRSSALDVIQASAALAEARLARAEAAHRRRLALARLVRATGTIDVLRGGESP